MSQKVILPNDKCEVEDYKLYNGGKSREIKVPPDIPLVSKGLNSIILILFSILYRGLYFVTCYFFGQKKVCR